MKSYTTFTMLVGISGAGKSTYAENLAKQTNAVCIASDKIREDIYGTRTNQKNPKLVFDICHKAIIENLSSNVNVVFDATNLKRKNRAECLTKIKEQVKNENLILQCHILVIPFDVCLEQNAQRNYPVPNKVLENQLCSFEIPFMEEGWHDIQLIPYKEHFFSSEKLITYSLDRLKHEGKIFYDDTACACDKKLNLFQQAQERRDNIGNKYKKQLQFGNIIDASLMRHIFNACVLQEYGKMSNFVSDKNMLLEKYAQVGTYELLCDCLEKEYFVKNGNNNVFEVSHRTLLNDNSTRASYIGTMQEILNTLFYVNYHNYNNQAYYFKSIEKNKYDIFDKVFGQQKFNGLRLMR